MALSNALNFYLHTQLNSYTHQTLSGTVHFSILVTVTGSREIISAISPVNTVDVAFSSTSAIDKWECRATLANQPSGLGLGLLVGSGNAVSAGVQTQFNVKNTALTLGDGVYRISMYVQKDNIWYGG